MDYITTNHFTDPQSAPHFTMATALLLLLAGFLALFVRKLWRGISWTAISEYKNPHLVQSMAQGSIYFYVGGFFPGLLGHGILVVYQLVFANLFYFLFTLATENRIRIGLSVFPIVLSVNLFLWFYPQYFVFHLAIIVIAILTKKYVVREVGGKTVHVFNPSAIVMAGVALIVIGFNLDHMIKTDELLRLYQKTPDILLWVFVVGTCAQWAGNVAPVAWGAFSAVVVMQFILKMFDDSVLTDYWVNPSVFIGITLLITDPVTSPKKKWPQFVFGAVYGATILPLFIILVFLRTRGFYDKLLMVPVMNYLAPAFEGLRVRWEPYLTRAVLAAAYAFTFALSYPIIYTKKTMTSTLKAKLRIASKTLGVRLR